MKTTRNKSRLSLAALFFSAMLFATAGVVLAQDDAQAANQSGSQSTGQQGSADQTSEQAGSDQGSSGGDQGGSDESDGSSGDQASSGEGGSQGKSKEKSDHLGDRPAEKAPLAPYSLLLDVAKVGDMFVAVGAHGDIVRSSDGIHWTQSESPVQVTLTAVDFVDKTHGWAVGHAATIIATDDGGKTWSIQHFDPSAQAPFLDVQFFNKNKGFAVGAYSMFYKTDNGGKTWTKYTKPLSSGQWHYNGIAKLGDGSIVIAGETGLLSRSTDGGKTWTLLDGPYSGTYFGVRALGKKGVLLYGLRGNAYYTKNIDQVGTLPPDTDLGYQFKKPPTMDTKESAEDKKAALAAAEKKQAEKKVARSAWTLVKNKNSYLSLFGAHVTKEGNYILVGTNGVIWQSNGISAKVRPLPNTHDGSISAVAETDDGNLVMVGENGAFYYRRNQ